MATLKDSIITGDLRVTGTIYGLISGNAATAATLQTPRTINGTNFDGSANITTANWGTSRTITIGSTGKSVNGSGNVSWTLAEIGAAASTHTHATSLASGGTATVTLAANTAYTLTAGGTSVVFKTPADNNTTYTAASSVTAVSTTSAVGTSTAYARQDHVHNIVLATGDANGQVKIAGSNVSVKGLGTAAYTASTAYSASTHNHDSVYLKLSGGTLTGALNGTYFDASSAGATTAGKLSGLTSGHSRLYGNALYISNPATANDQGWVRVTGTGESDTVLEIATGDDAGAGEQIVVRQYNTSNAVARELKLLDTGGNTTLPGTLTMSGGKAINQILTGSGTAAQDKGEGVSPRYFPAKWTFNTGANAVNGDIFTIKIPVAGHNYGVFMSVNNGTNYYPVVANGTGRITTHYPNATYIQVIFESSGSAASMTPVAGADSVNGSTVSGGVFRVLNYYDANTTYSTMSAAEMATGTVTTARAMSASNMKTAFTTTIIKTGSGNGTISVYGTDVAVKGLGTAAYTASTAYSASTHTHATSLASGGTATVTLAANTTYTLTAGGTSVIFKTPADSNTTYTAASSVTAVSTTSAVGTSTAYARQDHTHNISLATGDSNGQVKIAGSNVSVKGLGTAAYTASTAYSSSTHAHGNIGNTGLMTASVTLASGDRLVVTDSSASHKMATSTISFDGSTTTKALTPKGTWETFTQGTINNAALTLNYNGTNLGSFTANASTATTISWTGPSVYVQTTTPSSPRTGDIWIKTV